MCLCMFFLLEFYLNALLILSSLVKLLNATLIVNKLDFDENNPWLDFTY